uniref:Uncharacterized protein n=1 Tax=Zooxanthella nutricula TaxID=1333877 RepID=A0A7S2LY75_9DINO|mmetsp:Transcript_66960/g.205051  ORF Transcript_66960/g.205051 Transcript_66960/m.205051 type:complete len:211 (+) Transcript_66960:3-635(+)
MPRMLAPAFQGSPHAHAPASTPPQFVPSPLATQTTAPMYQCPAPGDGSAAQLIWCCGAHEHAAEDMLFLHFSVQAAMEPVSTTFFDNTSAFTRWLFSQPRGSVTPSSIVIVGWRQAKPVAHAIHAARTGDTSLLRHDLQRPELSHVQPPGSDHPASTAVHAMIVHVPEPSQGSVRAFRWASEDGVRLTGLGIEVTLSIAALEMSVRGHLG